MRRWSSTSLRSVPTKRSAKAFRSGARIAVRTTRTPDDLNTSAKREPSFVSWSQTTTCGAASIVAFLACCAHHPSVGAYVTAAWRIVRRRRSRKKSTNTSRNRMSNVCAKIDLLEDRARGRQAAATARPPLAGVALVDHVLQRRARRRKARLGRTGGESFLGLVFRLHRLDSLLGVLRHLFPPWLPRGSRRGARIHATGCARAPNGLNPA